MMTTVAGSGVSMESIGAKICFCAFVEFGARARSKANFTSAESNALPSWNLTPCCRLNRIGQTVRRYLPALGEERLDASVAVDAHEPFVEVHPGHFPDRDRSRDRSDRAPTARSPCRERAKSWRRRPASGWLREGGRRQRCASAWRGPQRVAREGGGHSLVVLGAAVEDGILRSDAAPAVDLEHDAGHEVGLVGSEVEGRIGDVLRARQAAERNGARKARASPACPRP